MWATDLKTGLKGSKGYTLLAAHGVYRMPRVGRCLVDIMPRLAGYTTMYKDGTCCWQRGASTKAVVAYAEKEQQRR